MPASFLGSFTAIRPSQTRTLTAKLASEWANPLAFKMQQQQCDNWCWAAVTSSIEAYYPPPGGSQGTPQCQLAMTYTGEPNCCSRPVPCACDKQNNLVTPLSNSGHLQADPIDGPIQPGQIADQIRQGNPICCQVWIGGDSSRGHFLVITGYDAATNDVIAVDPARDGTYNGTFPWQGERTFSGAIWSQTFLTS